jgi:hypothetical protein
MLKTIIRKKKKKKKNANLPNDRVRTDQLQLRVLNLQGSFTSSVGGDVTQVTDVTNLGLRGTVGLTERVVMRTSRDTS